MQDQPTPDADNNDSSPSQKDELPFKRTQLPDHVKRFTKPMDSLDKFIVGTLCEPMSVAFYESGHTANGISFYGLLFDLMYLFALYQADIVRFTAYFWLAYIFDCLDGFYARKYNMESVFGDIFEHCRDIASILTLFAILYSHDKFTWYITVAITLGSALTGFHVAAAQRQIAKREKIRTETLDSLVLLNFGEKFDTFALHYGVGMYMLTLNILVIFMYCDVLPFVELALLGYVFTVCNLKCTIGSQP